jgi:hypothetical protein
VAALSAIAVDLRSVIKRQNKEGVGKWNDVKASSVEDRVIEGQDITLRFGR